MMITPGTNDSSAVFALLSAIKDPETAKASLQEILDASAELEKAREAFKADKDASYAAVSSLQEEGRAAMEEATRLTEDYNKTYSIRQKQLADLEADLSRRQGLIEATERTQNDWDSQLKQRENDVTAREASVSQKNDAADKLYAEGVALKELYAAKCAALNVAMNTTDYTMKADTGTLGAVFNGSV